MTSEAPERLEVLVQYAVRGAARPRASRRGRDKVAIHMDPAHSAAEQVLSTTIYLAARAAGWSRVARPALVSVDVELVVARPQAEMGSRWPDGRYPIGGKPDVDNVAKLVMDAATKAGVWDDDTQVWDLRVRRWRVARGQEASTRVVFERLRGP